MNQPASSHQRLHDLDALRAAAMALGIVYHAALSFSDGFPWMVQDVAQAKWAFIFQAWVHGFRMPLFILVSGFFTAMLWRQKGLKALLWHRCRRVLFPCLLGLITIVPAVKVISGMAMSRAAARNASPGPGESASASHWDAIRLGDVGTLEARLTEGMALTNLHPKFGVTALQWAGINGQRRVTELLLDRGTPVDARSRDGHTALHSAAFMGHAEVVSLLIARGADVNARSNAGETPLQSAELDFGTVQFISGLLGLSVDEARWKEGRKRVQTELRRSGVIGKIWQGLTGSPVFGVLWFLWFLIWLVALFTIYALLANRLGWKAGPHWLVLSPANLLWLVPLTLAPTAMMEFNLGIGPDTSMGIIPMPHVLAYYALFFLFGAIYYDCDDREGRLGRSWRWWMPATLLILFPLALEFGTGMFGFRDSLLPARFHRPASVFLQSLYAWAMSFASIGMFRALITRENRVMRYLSDSAYWLYIAHLPLCIAGQAFISQWRLPAWLKLPLLSLLLLAFLLVTYEFLVRYTWLGRLLNGPRKRPSQAIPDSPAPQASGR
jgi:hypothetical protein